MNSLISSLLSHHLLAQAYGAGTYSSVAYGSGVIQIGPFTLPDTGATLLGAIFIVFIAVGVGLLVWLHQRKKSRQPTDSN